MATKNGLRVYDEKASGKYKYRAILDYKHPYEDCGEQVTCGINSKTKRALDEAKTKLEFKIKTKLEGLDEKIINLAINEALELWHDFRKDSIAKGTHVDDEANT
ncbi:MULTISPECIES: hypothetical protein [Lactococcus]|uniref:hypothetical protein n=1 Tax=Lactococcus TaxID=1357 RepID=UPI0020402A34|nr:MULTISPECIES: hypothetical protein [Lactococcus]